MAAPGLPIRHDTARVASGERRATGVAGRAALTPWLVTLLLAAASGVAGFYAYEHYRLTREENNVLRTEVVESQNRAAGSEDRILALTAELSRARGEFAAQSSIAMSKTVEAERLESRLREALDKVGEVTASNQEINLQLVDKVLFRLGDAELTDKGKALLEKLGALLKEVPDRQIWVQGHTDDTPIRDDNAFFTSNWELSAARALTVVHYLETVSGVDPQRLAAVAFGQHRPVSKGNRPRNRRIEIVLYPPSLPVAEPAHLGDADVRDASTTPGSSGGPGAADRDTAARSAPTR
jgi:chemotaxis protein MotB